MNELINLLYLEQYWVTFNYVYKDGFILLTNKCGEPIWFYNPWDYFVNSLIYNVLYDSDKQYANMYFRYKRLFSYVEDDIWIRLLGLK